MHIALKIQRSLLVTSSRPDRQNKRLMNRVYKTPIVIVKGHETLSVPRAVGLYFFLNSVLLTYFDCYEFVSCSKHFKKYMGY